MNIPYIGVVKNKFSDPANPLIMKEEESEIEIFDEFAEGLFKIEFSGFLEIYYHFHKAKPYKLQTYTYAGVLKGIFGTRSPGRPSQLGSSIVKMLGRQNNILKVKGLDAIDGTPVIDIKPVCIPLNKEELDENETLNRKNNPRKMILANIWAGKTGRLLLGAGQIHGHFCTQLAMGVLMATRAMQIIRGNSSGLDEITAFAEKKGCWLDAIQYVTGCTLGNHRLVVTDSGRTVLTLTKPDRTGVGIRLRHESNNFGGSLNEHCLNETVDSSLFNNDKNVELILETKTETEHAFNLLLEDFDQLFEVYFLGNESNNNGKSPS